MPEFLDLLSVYYTCDAMAALRPLARDEITGCMDVYEAVKRHFAPVFDLGPVGTAERAGQMQSAYLGFLAWQEDNAALVSRMRSEAFARLGAEVPATFR